jgi:hypothetical protein
MVLVSWSGVRKMPFLSEKTGVRLSVLFDMFSNLFKARTGQYLASGNKNRSMYSPFGFLDFGTFTAIVTTSLEKIRTSQRSVSASLNVVRELASSSPSLKDPKNATDIAVHTTCFLLSDQLVSEISWLRTLSSGKDRAFLASFVMLE